MGVLGVMCGNAWSSEVQVATDDAESSAISDKDFYITPRIFLQNMA